VSAPGFDPPARFVSTRYQGSKQRSFDLFERALRPLCFESAVDLFGGTGAVSWLFKSWGKRVHFNDCLRWCAEVGTALVENAATRLDVVRAKELLVAREGRRYDDFVARTFGGRFFLPEEDRFIDVVAQNVAAEPDRYTRALGFYSLFQACLKKRPFNLFHRANLAVRLRDVPRSFGNKATWESPFERVFLEALAEANDAVFDNGQNNTVSCLDALACPLEADLVYLDPPYVRRDGAAFDYLDGYHFLEGLVEYDRWGERIDRRYKHLPFARRPSPFSSGAALHEALREIVARAKSARYVIVSYRDDGIPSIEQIEQMLRGEGRSVARFSRSVRYALSHRKGAEVVLVGERGASVSPGRRRHGAPENRRR
jgi:adenine-specific DNA methylase